MNSSHQENSKYDNALYFHSFTFRCYLLTIKEKLHKHAYCLMISAEDIFGSSQLLHHVARDMHLHSVLFNVLGLLTKSSIWKSTMANHVNSFQGIVNCSMTNGISI